MHTRAFCFELAEPKSAASPRLRSPPSVLKSFLIDIQKYTLRLAIRIKDSSLGSPWVGRTTQRMALPTMGR
jgi:hypothetical protein